MDQRGSLHDGHVYVVVQNDRDYTNSGCRNIAVSNTLDGAKINGWMSVVDYVSKPWMLDFFKRKRGDATSCGVPDFYIEEWDIVSSTRKATWRLGWTIEGNRHISMIDQHLKELERGGADTKHTLEDWKSNLNCGKVPEALVAITEQVCI